LGWARYKGWWGQEFSKNFRGRHYIYKLQEKREAETQATQSDSQCPAAKESSTEGTLNERVGQEARQITEIFKTNMYIGRVRTERTENREKTFRVAPRLVIRTRK
jgi:hypothetical protein